MRTFVICNIERLNPEIGVIGFPGWGNVGSDVLEKLIRVLDARAVAHIISYYFPDIMIADDEGFSSLPSLNAHMTRVGTPDILLITSKLPIDILPPFAYHQLLESAVRFTKKLGCKLLISVEGVGSHENRVFMVGSSKEIVNEFSIKTQIPPLRLSRLPGYSGVLISLSKLLKLDAIGIIQAMSNPTPNPELNADLFRKIFTIIVP